MQIKAGDVYEACINAYRRYIESLTGRRYEDVIEAIQGPWFGIEAWDELTPLLQRFYTDIANRLDKQLESPAREEES